MKPYWSKTIPVFLAVLALLAFGLPQLKAQEGLFGETEGPELPPDYSSPEPAPQDTVPQEEVPPEARPGPLPDFEQNLVEIPLQAENPLIDAGDFRDPYFFLRGYNGRSKEALKPGTTVDGLRFNSYNQSAGFIDRYYKNSNFVLEDVYGRIELVNKEGGCLRCHRGIEEISQNHAFACVKCHRGNIKGKTVAQAHKNLVSNPSDMKYAPRFCGRCHKDQIKKVKNSLMASPRGIIEITREAWGEKPLKQPKRSKKRKKSKKHPWTYVSPGKPVDDFLGKKCLRCHINSPSPHRPGDYRATGCAACHMVYTNKGTSLSRDRAIRKIQKSDPDYLRNRLERRFAANSINNRRGYPLLHKFTVAIPSVQCEHCHNYNGVGNEFEGLFAKPAQPKTASAQSEENQPVLYGRSHEFLLPDIHREKGMHCIDCHGQEEVKADASSNATQHDAVKVRCETCHGTNSRTPNAMLLKETDSRAVDLIAKNQLNPNLMTKVKMGDTVMLDARRKPMPHVVLIEGKWILYSKVTGKKHKIPLLRFIRPRPYAHQIRGHMSRTECSACHARWSANEWGMHVIHEEELDRDQWKNWTLSDPTLQQSLSETAEPRKPAASVMGMLNWNSALSTPEGIKGSWIKGVWNHVFTETGWNSLILGINQRNRATVMKPRYQYFLTTRSKPGGQQPDRAKVPVTVKGKPGWVMMPHTPHTTRATTRPCESCHLSPLAAGLGEPTLKNIRDGKPFYKELIEANRVQPQFQIKQMVSRNGWSLQNPLPKGKLRFMKSKEIKALLKKTTRYKAYRYLDLRRNGHSRLLIRDEYPYDLKHKINEEKMGPPTGEEKLLYYDLDRHQFFTTQQAEPAPAREPAQPPPPGTAELPIPQADMPESVSPVPPPLDSPPGQADFFIDLKSSEPDPDLPSAQE